MLMFAFMFMFIYKQSLLHQMTHYRVLKQHHHPQPNTTKSTGPQTATTQIYKPHHKTTNPQPTTTKTHCC